VNWSRGSPAKRSPPLCPEVFEVKGRVRSVNEGELVLDVSKSSNSSLYPQGAHSIPRRLISEVKVKDSARKWLAPVLSAGAGGGAFMAFLPYGISENRRGVSDGTRISQNVAVGAAAAFAGYFAGKKLATSTHILRIAP